jgi:hypothetical protein
MKSQQEVSIESVVLLLAKVVALWVAFFLGEGWVATRFDRNFLLPLGASGSMSSSPGMPTPDYVQTAWHLIGLIIVSLSMALIVVWILYRRQKGKLP